MLKPIIFLIGSKKVHNSNFQYQLKFWLGQMAKSMSSPWSSRSARVFILASGHAMFNARPAGSNIYIFKYGPAPASFRIYSLLSFLQHWFTTNGWQSSAISAPCCQQPYRVEHISSDHWSQTTLGQDRTWMGAKMFYWGWGGAVYHRGSIILTQQPRVRSPTEIFSKEKLSMLLMSWICGAG